METPFLKMHGLGNDFAVFDARRAPVRLDGASARAVADRRRGVGCDQVIVIEPPKEGGGAEAAGVPFMRIFNADGGEAGACGNATRCVGALLMAETGAETTAVETLAGVLNIQAAPGGAVRVDMGPVRTDWSEVPLARETDTLEVDFALGPFARPVCHNVGNPHAVFFVENAAHALLEELGPQIEHDPLFPERVNVQAVTVMDRAHLALRTWERGAGLTKASASGACAALVGAVRRGFSERRAEVRCPGGALMIEWDDNNRVHQEGPVSHAYTGVVDIAALTAAAQAEGQSA
ncbi:MAG: diaminopimelate epimerase [Rhodospirillales bacterium]